MSTLKAEIVEVDVENHPNADRLDVLKIRGKSWQCVAQKGLYKSGDKVIYLPIDSVLPEKLIKELGIEKYYSKRLRTVKLRGTISQGMVAPLNVLPALIDMVQIGDDVTKELNITKYDPPIPVHMSGKVVPYDGRFIKYTDIENFKNYPLIFQEGEMVALIEKVHGTNARAANIEEDFHVGSHNMDLVEDPKNLYWRGAEMLDIKNRLEPGEQVFFEIFGSGIQDLVYGKNQGEVGVAVFDFTKDGKYLNYPDYLQMMIKKGWNKMVAPTVTMGKWSKDFLKLAEEQSIACPDQLMEGFVLKPMEEENSYELQGRKILKVVSDRYLLRKDGTERH